MIIDFGVLRQCLIDSIEPINEYRIKSFVNAINKLIWTHYYTLSIKQISCSQAMGIAFFEDVYFKFERKTTLSRGGHASTSWLFLQI